MPFAEEFINAFIAGQQARESKLDYQRKQRQMLFEDEDRVIEKEMLQHRMKELKIRQRLQARQVAMQNLEALSGIPEREVTPDMTEGGVLPARSATGDDSIQTLLKEIEIPGVEELGQPGFKRRPQTEESQLARTLAEARIKAITTPYNISPGQKRAVNGVTIDSLPDRPRTPIGVTNRDPRGVETTVYHDPADVTGMTSVRQPLPRRPSTVVQMPSADIAATVSAVKAGRFGPEDIQALPVRDRGAVLGALAKEKFDLNRVRQDARAIRTHYSNLNSDARMAVRIAADVVDQDLQELEDIQAAWKSSGRGVFSRAALATAKKGFMGPEAQKSAVDFEATVQRLQAEMAALRASGSNPSNALLDAAANELNTGSNIERAIARIRREVQHRVAAIGSLEAITPSSQEQSQDADFDFDPATGELVPRR